MTETIMDLINALGGWEIMIRAGAVVALASLIRSGVTLKWKLNAFTKRGIGFVAAFMVALIWTGWGNDLGREVIKNWFAGTVLWSIALKPMLQKLIESWKPTGQ